VTFPSSNPPPYAFQEEELFAAGRARLVREGVSEQEIDVQVMGIQLAIMPNPFEAPWSQPLDENDPEGKRSAVSSATPAEPNAVMVVFTLEGELIRLWAIRRR
jgi:hypothetical protein